MKKPSEYHKEGYTCSEAIVKSYNDEFKTNIPVAIASGMGTGFASGSLCGALGGATIVIGYLKGRSTNEEVNEARGLTKKLMEEIKSNYETEICKELKQKRISCAEIIDSTYNTLKEIIEKNK
ncbi:MAG: C-GCAxxG-C-C family (seleno)protein [Clostridium perfringens]|nr:C-GCAxxG-C-C family (seleno)protein [Clostridium perfringens]